MTIAQAIVNIQAIVASLSTDIKVPPSGPPESINVFPFGVSYLSSGTLELESFGWSKHFHTIFTEIHVSRQLLPQSIAKAVSYIDPFFVAIMNDPNLGGSVSVINDIRYKFGRLEWGGIETIGERFEITVKILNP